MITTILLLAAQSAASLSTPKLPLSKYWELLELGQLPVIARMESVTYGRCFLSPLDEAGFGEKDELFKHRFVGNVAIRSLAAPDSYQAVFDRQSSNDRDLLIVSCSLPVGNGRDDQLESKEGHMIRMAKAMGPTAKPMVPWAKSHPRGPEVGPPFEMWAIHDIHHPVFVSPSDGMDLLFSGTYLGGGRQFTWIGNLASESQGTIEEARYIGEGDDPRHAYIDGQHVVVSRAGRFLLSYRSADLESWTDMGELSPDLAFASFDLTVLDGEPILAAVEVSMETKEPVATRKFDWVTGEDGEGRWVLEETLYEPQDPARFRLLPNGDVLSVDGEGRPVFKRLTPLTK